MQIEDWCTQCGKTILRVRGQILTLEQAIYCDDCIKWWSENPPHDLKEDQMPIPEDQEQDELEKTEDPKRERDDDDDEDEDEPEKDYFEPEE